MQYDRQQPSPPRSEKRTAVSLVVVTFIVGSAAVVWALNKREALSYPSLRVESLILVDKDGAERLRMQGEGSAQVDVLSKQGKSVASIYSNGRNGALAVHGQQGVVLLGNSPVPKFCVLDVENNVRSSFTLEHWPTVSVASGDGRSRVKLEMLRGTTKGTSFARPSVTVRSETPMPGFSEALGPDKECRVEVNHASLEAVLGGISGDRYSSFGMLWTLEDRVNVRCSNELQDAVRAALQF